MDLGEADLTAEVVDSTVEEETLEEEASKPAGHRVVVVFRTSCDPYTRYEFLVPTNDRD